MSDILIRASIPRDARWSYDDPSGVPEMTPSVRPADTHRGAVTPRVRLIALVTGGLVPRSTPKAA
jgi:hypothetical protein